MKNMISFFSFGIEHNDGTLPSMGNRVRENIDDDHSGNNQGKPDNGSHVKVLFENEKADKRNKNDTHSRPNGVSYAYRDALQYDTQAIESRRVPQNGQYGWNEFGKLFALFQKRGGYGFKNDSQKQDKISLHCSFISVIYTNRFTPARHTDNRW